MKKYYLTADERRLTPIRFLFSTGVYPCSSAAITFSQILMERTTSLEIERESVPCVWWLVQARYRVMFPILGHLNQGLDEIGRRVLSPGLIAFD